MSHLTEQDQADLAARFIDTPWCVYAQGLDEVFCCETSGDDANGHPIEACDHRFDLRRATMFAEQLRTTADAMATMPGVQAPAITAFVLWHGIVWVYR